MNFHVPLDDVVPPQDAAIARVLRAMRRRDLSRLTPGECRAARSIAMEVVAATAPKPEAQPTYDQRVVAMKDAELAVLQARLKLVELQLAQHTNR